MVSRRIPRSPSHGVRSPPPSLLPPRPMTAWESPSRPAGRADLLRILSPRPYDVAGERLLRTHSARHGQNASRASCRKGRGEEDLTSYSAPAFAGRACVAAARPRSAFSSIADEAAAARWGGGGCVRGACSRGACSRGACSRGAAPATGRPLPPLSPSYIHHFALRCPCAALPRRPPVDGGRSTRPRSSHLSPPCMPLPPRAPAQPGRVRAAPTRRASPRALGARGRVCAP